MSKSKSKAVFCGFGEAPEQVKQGYKGIGTIICTEEHARESFFGDCRIVRGANASSVGPNQVEWYVMVPTHESAVLPLLAVIRNLEKALTAMNEKHPAMCDEEAVPRAVALNDAREVLKRSGMFSEYK